jgi:hypothetical protein
MQTPTQIANDALSQIGASLISTIDSDSQPNAVLCKQYYDMCWMEVLQEYPWRECIERVDATAGEVETQDFKSYVFLFPSDMVTLLKVYEINGVDITNLCDIRGNKVYTDTDEVYFEYVSSAGILLDTYGLATSYVPMYVQHLVALLMASKIAFRITQNETIMRTLYQEYLMELQKSKIRNGTHMSSGGEEYWGR